MKKPESPTSPSATPDDELLDLESIPPEVHAAVQALLRAFAKSRRPGATPLETPPSVTSTAAPKAGSGKPN
jgi:hypothetical protein